LIVANHSDNFYIAKNSTLLYFAELAFTCLKVSFISCFWVFVLSQNDMIFGFFRRFLNRIAEMYYIQNNVVNFKKNKLTDDLLKPVLTCEICVGANLAFWVYAINSKNEFVLIDLIFTLSLTTFITIITSEKWQKI
jgi:hypothetical protein